MPGGTVRGVGAGWSDCPPADDAVLPLPSSGPSFECERCAGLISTVYFLKIGFAHYRFHVCKSVQFNFRGLPSAALERIDVPVRETRPAVWAYRLDTTGFVRHGTCRGGCRRNYGTPVVAFMAAGGKWDRDRAPKCN